MDDDAAIGKAGTIVRGAFTFGVGTVVANFFGVFINLLLTNALGAAAYGVYVYGSRIISIVAVFAQLGSGNALLRFIPKHEGNVRRQNQTLGLVVVSSLIASCTFGGVLFVFAPTLNSLTLDSPLFTGVLRVLAILLPFKTLSAVFMAVFRSLERLEYQVFVGDVASPIIRLTALGIAILIGASTVGVVAALVVAGIVVTISAISLMLARTPLRPELGSSREEVIEYFNYSLPLTASRAGSLMYNRADILMVGIFLSSAAVGIYGIAILIAGFLTLPLTALNQLFPPIASDLYERNRTSELRSLFRTNTRWSVTLSSFLAASVVIYRRELLALFGEEFVAGAGVISLYAIGKLTNAVVGPSGFMLMMTDHQYLTTVNQWVAGVLNVVLNYVLILEFGIIGAAVATASTEAIINLTRLWQVWYFEGLHPYSSQFLKPILAIGLTSGVMVAVRQTFEGFRSAVLGGTLGGLVLLLTLVVLGLENEDLELVKATRSRVTTVLFEEG